MGMTILASLAQKKEGVYGHGHNRPHLLCQNKDDEDEDKRGRDEDKEDGEIEREEETESGRVGDKGWGRAEGAGGQRREE